MIAYPHFPTISLLFLLFFFWCVPGWRLSNESIRAGLESAFLLGRNQILTQKESERLGLSGATILLDGGGVMILDSSMQTFLCKAIITFQLCVDYNDAS